MVPPTATSWEAKQVSCPDHGVQGPSPGGTAGRKSSSILAEVLVAGGSIGFDRASRTHNAAYELLVSCDPRTDGAADIARAVIQAPPGTPIPGNVTVVFLAEAFQDIGSGRIVSLGQSPFLEFRVELNGITGYGDLSTATNDVQEQVAPNLWTVTTEVSLADVHGYDQWNSVRIQQRLANHAGPTLYGQSMMIPD